MIYYTIYKVTNQINGKIYIGSHKTRNLDDKYMGSGKYLNRAYQKYGLENFSKEILFIFDNAKEMYVKEAEIVNENFLTEENTYNLKRGGSGGFDYLNNKEKFNNPTHSKEHMSMMSIKVPYEIKIEAGVKGRQVLSNMIKEQGGVWWKSSGFTGKKHSNETKRTMSDKGKVSSKGDKNSQFGTMWITDGTDSAKIKKNLDIPQGWYKGRTSR